MGNIYKDYCYEVFNAEIKKENDLILIELVYKFTAKRKGPKKYGYQRSKDGMYGQRRTGRTAKPASLPAGKALL